MAVFGPPQLGLYGVNESYVKSVLTIPQMSDDSMNDQNAEFIQRQKEEIARAEARGAKPIDATAIPPAGRYELGASKSDSLLKHQEQNKRMCGSSEDGCIIC